MAEKDGLADEGSSKEFDKDISLNDEDVFEVEEIVGIRKQENKTLYRVRWLGYGPQQDTWEPIENLLTCKDMIDNYVNKKKNSNKRQKSGKWVMVPVDDAETGTGSSSDPHSLLRDPFWKNLEAGRINVFEGGDMYSKVKGRATRPLSYNENALSIRKADTTRKSLTRNERTQEDENKTDVISKRKGRKRKKISSDCIPSIGNIKTNSNDDLLVETEAASNLIDELDDKCKLDFQNLNKNVNNHCIVEFELSQKNTTENDSMNNNFDNDVISSSSIEPQKCVNNENEDLLDNIKNNLENGVIEKFDDSMIDNGNLMDSKPTKTIESDNITSKSPIQDNIDDELLKKTDFIATDSIDVNVSPLNFLENDNYTELEAVELENHNSYLEKNCSKIHISVNDNDDNSSNLKFDVLKMSPVQTNLEAESSASVNDSFAPFKFDIDSVVLDEKADELEQCNASLKEFFMEPSALHNVKKDNDDLKFDLEDLDSVDWIQEELRNQMESLQITNLEFGEAVRCGNYEVVKNVLSNPTHSYDLEQPDTNGSTLLMSTAITGLSEIAELLVVHGADINARHRSGNTALLFASDKGKLCTVSVLCQLGANLDLQQCSGETALMKASKKGHTDIARCLLENGANFAVVNHQNQTALSLAKIFNHPETYDWLSSHISRLTNAFEAQVVLTLNNTATLQKPLFQLQCLSLNQGPTFNVSFHHNLQALDPGVGMLLFIAHARITPLEIKCRLYGQCAVVAAYLNQIKLSSLTEEAQFVLSFCPLQDGRNDLVIHCISAQHSKCKLLVCAYQARLTNANRCLPNGRFS